MKLLQAFQIFLVVKCVSSSLPLLAYSRFTFSDVPEDPCPFGDGVQSCTDDCKGLVFCFNNKPYNINCYDQTGRPYCNSNTLSCDTKLVECPTPIQECPGIGYYPHLTNCTKFLICNDDKQKAVEGECMFNMIFDPVTTKCVFNQRCVTFSTNAGQCMGRNGTYIPHPLNNNLYVFCQDNKPLLSQCKKNHVFNPSLFGCEFKCPDKDFYPDSEKPNCFIDCTSTGAGLKPNPRCCPGNLIYDDDRKTCVSAA